MNIITIMEAISKIGPAIAAIGAVREVIETAIDAIADPKDQAEAKAILADVIADNDAGYARLKAKLKAAGA